ncbi:MAG TPA: C25 family cysteine peptidase [Candidatus Krumholzibacteria bacterium]|nr:C25 family cysteine peptidase [Candidatus Krumholzibacteria bacterium]
MRKLTLFLSIASALCLSAWLTLRAGTEHVHITIATSSDDIHMNVSDGTASFSLPSRGSVEFSLLQDVGMPAVPYRVVRVVLPAGRSVQDVQATAGQSSVIGNGVTVKKTQMLLPSTDTGRPSAMQSTVSIAAPSGDTFPGEFARYLGTGTWHGYSIASFAVFPVRVESDRVVLYGNIQIDIGTTASGNMQSALRAGRATARTVADIDDVIRQSVVNPEAIDAYAPIRVSEQQGPFQPTGVPSLEGSPVECVIITTEALAAEFDSLATWKTAKGVPTVVKTVEWIEANYPRGTDRAETVRFFIQDAYQKWGVQWVLLGGDTSEIPARYLYSTYFYGGTDIPNDIYFAGLDGDFNANHNSTFGEVPGDDPDLYPEVYVGRLPVSTTSTAHAVISKIERYETPIKTDYLNKVLYLAEVLFPSPWDPPQTILQNGADYTNYINSLYVASPSRITTRCYETEWLYPGSVHESGAIAIDSLNAGYNQVFHVGHGFRFNMHCGDANVAIPDADALHNTDEFFNLYMLNCTAAAFDYDCLAEHMLRNPQGGAVSALGATNSTFAEVSAYYLEDYVQELYTNNDVNIGKTFALSRAQRTPLALASDNVELWTHYVYELLADPEMPMWTATPENLVLTHSAAVTAGRNSIVVTAMVNGLPRSNVKVCLWKTAEDYQVVTTNVSGQAVFNFNTPTVGSISVVGTGLNLTHFADTITVNPTVAALPAVESIAVDDDNTGGTSGNGDGVIDAGETIDLTPAVRNLGGATAPTLTATFLNANPWVTLLDSSASIPSTAAGQLVAATDPWRIQVSASTPDEAIANFNVLLVNGGQTWVNNLARVVHAPRLAVTGLRKSDEIPVGNGDGIYTNGEQFLLYATVKNYGTGRADGLTAVLRELDGGSTLVDTVTTYPNLSLLQSSENTVAFKLSEANVSLPNALRVVVTDSHGRVLTHNCELREPLPPTLQSFDPSLGVDKMGILWTAGASSDVAGYNIYRSTNLAGPYTRANSDVISHTVFTDAGLSPNTRYYYEIASVDESGNEGARSPAAPASTNPPQLAGWPNELVNESANSPAVGDIDGYGKLEVVVGNDKLYAWHDNGDEVLDGDQKGITWGPISSEGTDFVGPAALADLDGVPGFEIAAAAYTSKQVFCFKGDGTVMPGWPQDTVDMVRASVVIGDIDGDGSPEIIAVDQDAYLYAWHVDGTEVIDGDANPLTNGVFKRLPDTNQWQYQTPALADIDNDGKEEIIIPTQDMKVYVLNEVGGNEPGWPFQLNNYAGGGVAVGDIDNNGQLDITFTTRSSGEIYALRPDGSQLWQTWINTNLFFNPSPALADLTGDGKLETIIPASNGRLYAIQYDGSEAPGWPVYYSTKTYTESSPVVADVNGDGSVDVLLGDEDRFINAWSSTGVPLAGFPLVMKDAVRGTPCITDLNKDGLVDIVGVGYDKTVYVWSLSTPYNPALAPWPMYHGNVLRNGRYGTFVATGVGDTPAAPSRTRLAQNYPNPFNPATRISYEIAAGPAAHVTLTIYDVTGARVRTLVDQILKPGAYSVQWDGRDGHGSAVGSGVYFYRLSTPAQALTRKMVLLK